jgi:hypothetical protein
MRSYPLARIYGPKLYESSYIHTSKINLQKLFLEKYLDISFMVVLNVHAWIQYPHINFWDPRSPWNTFNSIWNLIWVISIVVIPIYAYVLIRMNRDNLESEELIGRVGVFYEEQRFSTLHGSTFNIREMGRRLLMVLVITLFNGLPYFQIAFLTVLSFLTLWMIAYDNAFVSKEEN